MQWHYFSHLGIKIHVYYKPVKMTNGWVRLIWQTYPSFINRHWCLLNIIIMTCLSFFPSSGSASEVSSIHNHLERKQWKRSSSGHKLVWHPTIPQGHVREGLRDAVRGKHPHFGPTGQRWSWFNAAVTSLWFKLMRFNGVFVNNMFFCFNWKNIYIYLPWYSNKWQSIEAVVLFCFWKYMNRTALSQFYLEKR